MNKSTTEAETFETRAAAMIARLMEPLRSEDGENEQEILAAEARLGVRLPGVLRTFYQTAGNRHSLFQPFIATLRYSTRVQVEDGVIVLGIEDHGAWHIGVLIGDAHLFDPPVVFVDADTNSFKCVHTGFFPRLSDYLLGNVVLQAVACGMPFLGTARATRDFVGHGLASWEMVRELAPWEDIQVYLHERNAVVVADCYSYGFMREVMPPESVRVYVGANGPEDRERIGEALNLDWQLKVDHGRPTFDGTRQ